MKAKPSYNPGHPVNTMLRDISAVVRQSCDAAAHKAVMRDICKLESIGDLTTQGDPWDKLTHGTADRWAEVGAA